MFKNYSCWINFGWDLLRSRYQCEIHTQWENWAEVTPGHSDNSQGNRYTRQLWLGQTFIQGSSHIYLGLELLADYKGGDTKHSFTLIMGERNNIVSIL